MEQWRLIRRDCRQNTVNPLLSLIAKAVCLHMIMGLNRYAAGVCLVKKEELLYFVLVMGKAAFQLYKWYLAALHINISTWPQWSRETVGGYGNDVIPKAEAESKADSPSIRPQQAHAQDLSNYHFTPRTCWKRPLLTSANQIASQEPATIIPVIAESNVESGAKKGDVACLQLGI